MIKFSSVFRKNKLPVYLVFFQDLNDLFGLNILSHFRNGNKPIYSFWRHTMVVVYRLSGKTPCNSVDFFLLLEYFWSLPQGHLSSKGEVRV